MVFIHPDVTKAAIICTLENDSTTGVSRVLHPDGFAIGKDVTIYATTVEEFTILKHMGYNVRLNEHPSKATMEGVEVNQQTSTKQIGVAQIGQVVE